MTIGRRLLLVEDEPGLRMTLGDRLNREGFEVLFAHDGHQAIELGCRHPLDLIILDIMLPGVDGYDVCRVLRQEHDVLSPILMLTARDHLADKVAGLRLGADDYLTKPFELDELLARIDALLRRSRMSTEGAKADVWHLGELRIDLRRSEAIRNHVRIALSHKEAGLLRHLLRHAHCVVTRQELLDQVWGYNQAVSSRTVDVHMVSLRKKIEIDPRKPRYLLTVHGDGYKLVPDDAP